MTDLGASLRRAGQRADSREILRPALDLAHRCGAPALTERTRTELIAAGGLHNRDIAQHLFITTRTVEDHLTHAYQKLAITSRDELHNALASRDVEVTAPRRTLG
jgi:DNA-binding CsgD family transcriptional regulator